MAMLMSLQAVKDQLGIEGAEEDERLTFAIEAASAAIIKFTGRDYTAPVVTEAREYLYDGSGVLDIDDATAVTAVSIEGASLTSAEWVAQPFGKPVRDYLELPPMQMASPEMGFQRNLDRWWIHALTSNRLHTFVTGTFGYASVPFIARQALVWTVADWRGGDDRDDDDLIGESIADMSRTWASPTEMTSDDLPTKARRLLEDERRVTL